MWGVSLISDSSIPFPINVPTPARKIPFSQYVSAFGELNVTFVVKNERILPR